MPLPAGPQLRPSRDPPAELPGALSGTRVQPCLKILRGASLRPQPPAAGNEGKTKPLPGPSWVIAVGVYLPGEQSPALRGAPATPGDACAAMGWGVAAGLGLAAGLGGGSGAVGWQ